ncbi:MAG: hypothetical protein JW821_18705 [Deltaproteobacteria bacterium]|nr:hypothetical protein [Deltaproteobacteria bacterium]
MERVRKAFTRNPGRTAFLLVLFCAAWIPAIAQERIGPKAVFREKAFTFAEVEQGAVVVHTFTLVNEGDEVLRIKGVSPD